ncbi:MAG: acyltransferase [Gammaproteobacteria bacterium]
MTLKLIDHGHNNQVDLQGELVGEEFAIIIDGNNNHVILGDQVSSHQNHRNEARIRIKGDGNLIQLDAHASLKNNAFIRTKGNDNRVLFADHCSGAFRIDIQTDGAQFEMGEGTTAVGMLCTMHEPRKIQLGKDCMFSAGVWLTASDMHSIIDLNTGKRINPGADVIVGDHVWFGFYSRILKGVQIGSGSVIGTAAVVTKDVPQNCVVAGHPARVIRENIGWDRRLMTSPDAFSAATDIEF